MTGPGAPAEANAPRGLNDEMFESLRTAIVPQPEELSFEGVEWRSQLWSALIEAQRRDLPVLLWAMNGHPMACT